MMCTQIWSRCWTGAELAAFWCICYGETFWSMVKTTENQKSLLVYFKLPIFGFSPSDVFQPSCCSVAIWNVASLNMTSKISCKLLMSKRACPNWCVLLSNCSYPEHVFLNSQLKLDSTFPIFSIIALQIFEAHFSKQQLFKRVPRYPDWTGKSKPCRFYTKQI